MKYLLIIITLFLFISCSHKENEKGKSDCFFIKNDLSN